MSHESRIGDFLSYHSKDTNLCGLPTVHQSHPDLLGIFDRGGDTLFSVSRFSRNGNGNYRNEYMAYVVAPDRVIVPVRDSYGAGVVFWDFPEGVRTEREVMLQTALTCFGLYLQIGDSLIPDIHFDERLRSDKPLIGDRSHEIGRVISYASDPTARYSRHVIFLLHDDPEVLHEITLEDISFHDELIAAVETEASSNPRFLFEKEGIDTRKGWYPIKPASAPPPTGIENILKSSLPGFDSHDLK